MSFTRCGQVIIMGDGSVGKTSLVMRFTKDYFSTTYKQTIGLDFFIKRLEMPSGALELPKQSGLNQLIRCVC